MIEIRKLNDEKSRGGVLFSLINSRFFCYLEIGFSIIGGIIFLYLLTIMSMRFLVPPMVNNIALYYDDFPGLYEPADGYVLGAYNTSDDYVLRWERQSNTRCTVVEQLNVDSTPGQWEILATNCMEIAGIGWEASYDIDDIKTNYGTSTLTIDSPDSSIEKFRITPYGPLFKGFSTSILLERQKLFNAYNTKAMFSSINALNDTERHSILVAMANIEKLSSRIDLLAFAETHKLSIGVQPLATEFLNNNAQYYLPEIGFRYTQPKKARLSFINYPYYPTQRETQESLRIIFPEIADNIVMKREELGANFLENSGVLIHENIEDLNYIEGDVMGNIEHPNLHVLFRYLHNGTPKYVLLRL